ncbi:glutamine synthetase III [Christensenellaceae bacterium OttesenSCG-928-L17]|nr:glutamine synthetase III [Christensenellaceae bacterium OttesenSCG-928-L17]
MQLTKPFEQFGCDVFNDATMRERLAPDVYSALRRTTEEGRELTIEVASAVAEAMKTWALENGATHYTHWFQPMTGSTAEKHEAFLDRNGLMGEPMLTFSGKALIKGEADGSSFPSGGLRATFEARGYTTWDCTSPAFLKRDFHGGCLLCIPTAFCAFSGEALDEKTPLLRSMEAISREAVRLMRLLGHADVTRVTPTVGGEQEYFLIDKRHFLKRKDLVYTGRTLFGTSPAKGQELSDQYYASTPEPVIGFMRELDETLWRLGVYAKTEHNEAAPAQYELAALYASANVATDHNQLIMEQMRRIADRHGFTCLLHEKPFANVNGSGKHDNWSLTTNTGKNLLKPGKTDEEQRIFYTFVTAVLAAVNEYAPALRMACATLGNESRLGGNEAPPQILSVFTGPTLYEALMHLKQGNSHALAAHEHMSIGVSTLAVLHKDDTDRNRTSPFAFTGDKFEFRMVGASQSLGMPNTTINTIVAEMLRRIADDLEASGNPEAAWCETIAKYIRASERVIFNGNNYGAEWHAEAARRGLPNIESTVDAIHVMSDPAVQDVFSRHGVFSKGELAARQDIALWSFAQMARIEASTMLKISRQKILPASIRYAGEVARACNELKHAGLDPQAQLRVLHELNSCIGEYDEAIRSLREIVIEADSVSDDNCAYAARMRERVAPAMAKTRVCADALERMVDKEYWPLPSYGEMIFHII